MKTKILNQQDVTAQKERFEAFISNANLPKIGQRIMFFKAHDAGNGRYNDYCYLLRLLSILADVGGCYSHPEMLSSTWSSYRDILERKAIESYIKSIS